MSSLGFAAPVIASLALLGAGCHAKATAPSPDAGVARSDAPMSEPSSEKGQDLVFVGTIKDIRAAPQPGTHRSWVVTTHVDRVLSGRFAGDSFSFAVHSPSRAGLSVGGQYTIRAIWTGDGYTVDEQQWRQGPNRDGGL